MALTKVSEKVKDRIADLESKKKNMISSNPSVRREDYACLSVSLIKIEMEIKFLKDLLNYE